MIQEAMDRTLELLKQKKELTESLAKVLLDKEVLEREDMVAVLGPRPWAEKTSYDDFVAGTGGDNPEDSELPAGLRGWDSDPTQKTEEVIVDSQENSVDSEPHVDL